MLDHVAYHPGPAASEKRPRGFTLMEVIAALVIASVALVAILRLHLMSLTVCEAAECRCESVQLAQEKLAEVCAAGLPRPGSASGTENRNGHTLTWCWTVQPASGSVDETTGAPLRRVSAVVTWPSGQGQQSIEMTRLIADRTLP